MFFGPGFRIGSRFFGVGSGFILVGLGLFRFGLRSIFWGSI